MSGPTKPHDIIAIVLVVTACAFFAGANGFAKLAQSFDGDVGKFAAIQLVFCRYLFGLATITCCTVVLKPTSLKPRAPLSFHIGRTLVGFVGVTSMFIALDYLPLGDVTAISFSSPLFTLIFAAFFLKEFFHVRRAVAAVVGFSGVLLLLQPSIASLQLMALFALASAIFIGLELVIIRYLAQRDHPLVILLINNGLGVLVTLPIVIFYWQWPNVTQWPYFAAVGIVMASGQLLFVNAAARSEASFLAPFYFATILFAVLYGIFFFNEVPGLTSMIGALLIIASGIYIGLRTRTQT